jgi:hypothetical protein
MCNLNANTYIFFSAWIYSMCIFFHHCALQYNKYFQLNE